MSGRSTRHKPQGHIALLLLAMAGLLTHAQPSLAAEATPAKPRGFEFVYRVEISPSPDGPPLQVFIPVATTDDSQEILDRSWTGSFVLRPGRESAHGNAFLHAVIPAGNSDPAVFEIRYLVYRKPARPTAPGFDSTTEGISGCSDPKAHNLARREGIATRQEMGFPLPLGPGQGALARFDCWLMFNVPKHGWMPLSGTPPDRIRMSTGRNLTLARSQRSGPVDFFVHPLVENGTARYDKLRWSASYRDLDDKELAAALKNFGEERKSPHAFLLSAGATSLSYSQTGRSDLSMLLATLKAGYTYTFGKSWSASAVVYGTLLPIGSVAASDELRFMGLNLRLGYAIPSASRWSLAIQGGYYYATMLVPDNAFGYRSLSGPQLYPMVKYGFSKEREISGYFKFSPIGHGFGVRSFSDNEIAAGLAYTWRTGWGLRPVVALDWARLTIDFGDESVLSQTMSLSAGVTF